MYRLCEGLFRIFSIQEFSLIVFQTRGFMYKRTLTMCYGRHSSFCRDWRTLQNCDDHHCGDKYVG